MSLNVLRGIQKYSVFLSNTSGLGLANAVIGELRYISSNFPQLLYVINTSSIPQDLNPPPSVGTTLKYSSIGINTAPATYSILHISDALTRLNINLTPGSTISVANLTAFES